MEKCRSSRREGRSVGRSPPPCTPHGFRGLPMPCNAMLSLCACKAPLREKTFLMVLFFRKASAREARTTTLIGVELNANLRSVTQSSGTERSGGSGGGGGRTNGGPPPEPSANICQMSDEESTRQAGRQEEKRFAGRSAEASGFPANSGQFYCVYCSTRNVKMLANLHVTVNKRAFALKNCERQGQGNTNLFDVDS